MWQLITCIALLIAAAPALAQEGGPGARTIFLHGGDDVAGGGYLYRRPLNRWAFGFDITQEGERRDLTRNQNELVDATSFNAIVGIATPAGGRWGAALVGIIGLRSERTTCPYGQSYLGYRCFADTPAQDDWVGNFGVGLLFSVGRVSFGVRATDLNEAVSIGWNF